MRKNSSINFIHNLSNNKPSNDSRIFVFNGNQLLTYDDEIIEYSKIKTLPSLSYIKHIGYISDKACFTASIEVEDNFPNDGFEFIPLRKIYSLLDQAKLDAGLYAYQIHLWNQRTKYCGYCGSNTNELNADEAVKECSKCKQLFYPKISPSIIIAIRKGNKLLLAKHRRLSSGIPTILAGFVNPGESLEECIHREVYEEAGIKVKNIEYFRSQPWPFPDSLMIAFKAEYSEGELKADNIEITDLDWYTADKIPEWKDNVSIARWLIDDFIEKH